MSGQLKSEVKEFHDQIIPFKVVDLPGRGKGMVSSRLIKQGDLILTEKPIFIIPASISSDPVSFVDAKVRELTEEDRAAFFNLSHADVNIPEEQIPVSIIQTNGIAAGSDVGLFPNTARLNHGCSSAFNSVYSWRSNEGLLTVHALKEIPAGEELLTTYFDTKKPRDQRREFLKERYKFHCTCKVCSLPSKESRASDQRLHSITSLKEKLQAWGTGKIHGPTAIEIVRQIWKIGDEEGYWSERGQLAADAAVVAAAHSEYHATREWATLSQEWFGYELGQDSEQVASMAILAEAPRRHSVWGTRERVNVGTL
ncbi:hypothetical protein M422DRAFT_152563 [Sphaerobolus stellatus SS14]|nr:hypothetical protein M422DRAFT_152563 [Sphaerobolus stellatus SS14]